MTYLYWYLSIGVLILAFVYGAHLRTNVKETDSLREMVEALHPERKKLSYRILNNVVAPLLAAILVVAVWPIAVLMKGKELIKEKHYPKIEEKPEFAVEHKHLLEQLTVQEVERREIVTDPFEAVPELPFGHLNAAWKAFLDAHIDGSELWSFSAQWQSDRWRKELKSGYVIVQNGTPGTYFLTVLKDISVERKRQSTSE